MSPSGLREISRTDPEYWVNQAEIQSIQNRLRRMSGACTNPPVQSINLPDLCKPSLAEILACTTLLVCVPSLSSESVILRSVGLHFLQPTSLTLQCVLAEQYLNAKRRHAHKMLHYVDMEISKIMNKPTTLIDSLRRQCENPSQIYRQGSDVEQRLKKCKNGDASVKAIAEILAVGLLTATAAVATMGETKAFKSGCDSADFIGARSNKAVIELHPTRSLKYKKPTQTGGVYIDIMEDKFVALYPRAILRW